MLFPSTTRGRYRTVLALATALFAIMACTPAGAPDTTPTIAQKVSGMRAMPGFVNLWWDERAGKLWMDPGPLDTEMIYVSSLARGVGSNDLGLDRGQLRWTRIVKFQRVGPRVLLLAPNMEFRADSDNPQERAAVDQSFARTVLWGFDVGAQQDDRVLLDASEFFLRDGHGLAQTLEQAEEGIYAVDPQRSAIFLPATRAFPDNTEVEALVTFAGKPTGEHLATVANDPELVSVHLHHSFVRLPEPGFEILPYDPRAGYIDGFGVTYLDYAVAIEEPLLRNLTIRHRLRKKTPEALTSEPVEPIVYYLDPGAPEPVRGALLEGASWWNEAFEAAGYDNAFRVEMLPEDADPLDVRYNVIQWVHRSTRGWSYGSSIVDPRTGEILKGHVSLGSLRVKQDYLIAEGLLAPYTEPGQKISEAARDMALARIRQLSAHEVGHTLGLEHNFAGSVTQRASVMDYPHPLARLDADGGIDLSEAYASGIGAWDARAIVYGYQDFPAGVDRAAARGEVLAETLASGLHFVADQDARAPGSAHPLGNLWDNGSDAVAELRRLIDLRHVVLERFGENVIAAGRSLALIEEALVPAYLLHRYQLKAAAKLLGGQFYTYRLKGDAREPGAIVSAQRQHAALGVLMETLSPRFLTLPDAAVSAIDPRPPGHPRTRESFPRDTSPLFDPLGAAAAAIDLTLAELLSSPRGARLERFHAGDPELPGFGEVVQRILDVSWLADDQAGGWEGALRRTLNERVLEALMVLTMEKTAAAEVRAIAYTALERISVSARGEPDLGNPYNAQARYAAARIARLRLHDEFGASDPLAVPPGSPIGD